MTNLQQALANYKRQMSTHYWQTYNRSAASTVVALIEELEPLAAEQAAKLEDLHHRYVDLERRNRALAADLALADETIERLTEE